MLHEVENTILMQNSGIKFVIGHAGLKDVNQSIAFMRNRLFEDIFRLAGIPCEGPRNEGGSQADGECGGIKHFMEDSIRLNRRHESFH